MNKNITLSADENVIKKARLRAQKERRSLNDVFREWLARYVSQASNEYSYDEIMEKLSHVKAGRRFSRDEMNER